MPVGTPVCLCRQARHTGLATMPQSFLCNFSLLEMTKSLIGKDVLNSHSTRTCRVLHSFFRNLRCCSKGHFGSFLDLVNCKKIRKISQSELLPTPGRHATVTAHHPTTARWTLTTLSLSRVSAVVPRPLLPLRPTF